MDSIIVLTPAQLKQLVRETISEVLDRTPQPTQQEYFTREEASELLKVSLVTIDKYSKQGLIRSHRIGGRVLFHAEDIRSALQTIDDFKYKRR